MIYKLLHFIVIMNSLHLSDEWIIESEFQSEKFYGGGLVVYAKICYEFKTPKFSIQVSLSHFARSGIFADGDLRADRVCIIHQDFWSLTGHRRLTFLGFKVSDEYIGIQVTTLTLTWRLHSEVWKHWPSSFYTASSLSCSLSGTMFYCKLYLFIFLVHLIVCTPRRQGLGKAMGNFLAIVGIHEYTSSKAHNSSRSRSAMYSRLQGARRR